MSAWNPGRPAAAASYRLGNGECVAARLFSIDALANLCWVDRDMHVEIGVAQFLHDREFCCDVLADEQGPVDVFTKIEEGTMDLMLH